MTVKSIVRYYDALGGIISKNMFDELAIRPGNILDGDTIRNSKSRLLAYKKKKVLSNQGGENGTTGKTTRD